MTAYIVLTCCTHVHEDSPCGFLIAKRCCQTILSCLIKLSVIFNSYFKNCPVYKFVKWFLRMSLKAASFHQKLKIICHIFIRKNLKRQNIWLFWTETFFHLTNLMFQWSSSLKLLFFSLPVERGCGWDRLCRQERPVAAHCQQEGRNCGRCHFLQQERWQTIRWARWTDHWGQPQHLYQPCFRVTPRSFSNLKIVASKSFFFIVHWFETGRALGRRDAVTLWVVPVKSYTVQSQVSWGRCVNAKAAIFPFLANEW